MKNKKIFSSNASSVGAQKAELMEFYSEFNEILKKNGLEPAVIDFYQNWHGTTLPYLRLILDLDKEDLDAVARISEIRSKIEQSQRKINEKYFIDVYKVILEDGPKLSFTFEPVIEPLRTYDARQVLKGVKISINPGFFNISTSRAYKNTGSLFEALSELSNEISTSLKEVKDFMEALEEIYFSLSGTPSIGYFDLGLSNRKDLATYVSIPTDDEGYLKIVLSLDKAIGKYKLSFKFEKRAVTAQELADIASKISNSLCSKL